MEYPAWYSTDVWPRWLAAEGKWTENDKGSPSHYGVRFSDNQPALKKYGITTKQQFKDKFTQGMARQIIWDRYIAPVSDILEGWDPGMRKVGALFAGNVGGGPAALRRRWKDGTIRDLESLQQWGAKSYQEIYNRSPGRYSDADLTSWGRRLDPQGQTSLLSGEGTMAFGPMGLGSALQQTVFGPNQPAQPQPARAPYEPVNYPAPPQMSSEDAYNTAISEVRSLMQQDVVNKPQRPEPMQNPYQNPFVSLGLALQGKSADAVAAGARIDAMNQAREDQYDRDLLQAENYRLLRKQKLGTTLAGMQAEAAKAGIADDRWAHQMELGRLDREQSARQFEAGQEMSEEQLAFQREQATALAAYRQNQLDQTKSFTDFLSKKDNQEFANEFYGASDALSFYQRTGTIPGIDLADPNLTAADKTAALEGFTANLYAIADRMRRMGFVEESGQFYEEIGALERVERETISEFHGGSVLTPEGAVAVPTSAAGLEAAKAEQKRLDQAPATPGFDVFGDPNDFDTLSRFLDESLQRRAIEERVEGRPFFYTGTEGFTAQEQEEANLQVAVGQLREGLEQDKGYRGTTAGIGNIKSIASTLALRHMRGVEEGSYKRKDLLEDIKKQIAVEAGIPRAFLDNPAVTRVINRQISAARGRGDVELAPYEIEVENSPIRRFFGGAENRKVLVQ